MKDSGDMKLCRHVDSSIKCMTESIVWSFIQTKSKQTDNEVIFFIFRILNERKENGIFLVNHTGWRQIFVNMSTWPLRRYWRWVLDDSFKPSSNKLKMGWIFIDTEKIKLKSFPTNDKDSQHEMLGICWQNSEKAIGVDCLVFHRNQIQTNW